jgi:Glycosyl hydrolase family 12
MHRSVEPGQPGSRVRRRPAVVALAVVAVLAIAGTLIAVRQLSSGTGGGTGATALAAARRPAHPGTGHRGAPGPRPGASASPGPGHRVSSPAASAPASGGKTPAPRVTPTTTTTTTTTPPAAANSACTKPQFVTSAPTGGWTDGSYYVYNNMWNISGYSVTQTLYACSYRDWYVVADMNNDSGDGAVKTYPNVQETFSEPKISSFSGISSTFAETSPHVGIYEDAYDIWLNGIASSGSTEVMIWTENFNQSPAGSDEATASLGGRGYHVWRTSAGSYIAFVADANFTSGTVNLLQVFDWLIAKGWIPADSTLGQIDYGAEIVSTNNTPATFSFTNFSISAS